MTANKDYLDLGGTYRTRLPEATLQTLQPHLSAMGITRVANITGLDNIGIHVVTCIRPNSKHLSVSQGKGLTLPLAKISAIMESIEGYHAENPPEKAFVGSYQQLHTQHNLVDPNHFRRKVFAAKDLHQVDMPWVKVIELNSGTASYLPHALVHIDSTVSQLPHAYFDVSSNGLAAGNTSDEAVEHALLELIERDSLFQWQKIDDEARLATQVNIATIDDLINCGVLEKFSEAQQQVKVWDISSSLQVPAFHCAIVSNQPGQPRNIFTGTGAHVSKKIALSRALTEAAQGRLTVISGNRDDIFPDYYQQMLQELSDEPEALVGTRDYKTITQPEQGKHMAQQIGYLQQQLQQHGIKNIYVVDHTKPEFGIPVKQVFVPELKFNGVRF